MDTSSLVSNASFLGFAMDLDRKFCDKTRLKDCPHCGAKLHSACYERKGHNPENALPEGWNTFYGLCCSREGCRKRVRPPSVRFAGRSPCSSALVLLAQLLRSGGSQRSVIALCKMLKVSERTVRRWLRFWQVVCSRSRWWRELSSLRSLMGKSLEDLWTLFLEQAKNKESAFEQLISKSENLWDEIQFFVGDS